MKKFLLIAAGAAALFTLPAIAPVNAQSSTTVTVAPGGVSVTERDRRRGWRHRERCRTVVERVRRPNGTVITKRSRVCRD